jgi:hypothetical protein
MARSARDRNGAGARAATGKGADFDGGINHELQGIYGNFCGFSWGFSWYFQLRFRGKLIGFCVLQYGLDVLL